MIQEISKVTKY